MRRVREKYEEWGFNGVYDGRAGLEDRLTKKQLPVANVFELIPLGTDDRTSKAWLRRSRTAFQTQKRSNPKASISVFG